MEYVLKILETVGLPAAIVAVLIWWAYHKDKRQEVRYDKVCSKINEVQGDQRKELLDISVRAVAAQSESTAVQRETISVNKEMVAELKKITERPCVARSV